MPPVYQTFSLLGICKERVTSTPSTCSLYQTHSACFHLGAYRNKMIEVEKKFTVNDTVLGNLKLLGARLRKESTFTDIYYDNPNYVLTSNNFWLRQREGLWQLKSPVGGRSTNETLVNSSYKESELEMDILKLLLPIFCNTDDDKIYFKNQLSFIDDADKQCSILIEVLRHLNCKPFCQITTRRQTYELGEFNIDLDLTDTGYQVGEIELLSDGEENISSMAKKIDVLSEQLGNSDFKH